MGIIEDLDAAIRELELTDVFKKYGAGSQYNSTHTGKAELAVKSAKSKLTPPAPVEGLPMYSPPSFTPNRTFYVRTQTDFNNALSGLQAGDRINVAGFNPAGEIVITKRLPDWAEFRFDPLTCKFTGAAAGSRLPAMWIHGASHIRFVGLNVTGAGNDGIRMEDCDNIVCVGKVHDTAGTGAGLKSILQPCTNNEVWLETRNCGCDTSLDPHTEKGTGIHAFNSGQGAGTNYPVSNCKIVLDVYDQPMGAALEVENTVETDVWIRAKNLTKVATQQVAGNALQLWGSGTKNLRVHYLVADNVARGVETDALSTSNSGIVVEYARVTNARLSPVYADLKGTGQYIDCK